jgi:hypothetical protein
MQPLQADYFTAYRNVKLTRDGNGVLIVQLQSAVFHPISTS